MVGEPKSIYTAKVTNIVTLQNYVSVFAGDPDKMSHIKDLTGKENSERLSFNQVIGDNMKDSSIARQCAKFFRRAHI